MADVQLLGERGARLGLSTPRQFFWVTGALSSFLDNTPTYVALSAAASSLHGTDPQVRPREHHLRYLFLDGPLLSPVPLSSQWLQARVRVKTRFGTRPRLCGVHCQGESWGELRAILRPCSPLQQGCIYRTFPPLRACRSVLSSSSDRDTLRGAFPPSAR